MDGKNWRLGATLSVPLNRQHSIKVLVHSGVATRIGADFNIFTLAYHPIEPVAVGEEDGEGIVAQLLPDQRPACWHLPSLQCLYPRLYSEVLAPRLAQ